MQVLIENGIAFIIALQSALGDWFIVPMRFFSYLGNAGFFLLVLSLIYWCIDSNLGLRLSFILLTSEMLNYIGKLIFAGPRPYWVSTQVRALWSTEKSFGIPSGHAQNAASIWGMFAAYVNRTWVWVVSITVIFLIGFSRIYLGAHFPHDVIFGWFLGVLTFWIFMRFWNPVSAWVGRKTLGQQILIAFVVSLIFIMVGFETSTLRSGYQVPETWTANALLAGAVLPDPVDPSSSFTSAGALFGLAVGAAWIMSMGGFQAAGPIEKRAIRYVIGLVGALILYLVLRAIFPSGEGFIFYILRYIRYALLGWWATGGAPWVFVRFKLAERVDSI